MEQNELSKNGSIGEKIAAIRKAKGMTQGDVGAHLNISYQAVSKWERDESCPDFETISKLAKLFSVPITYFEKGVPVESATESEAAIMRGMLGVCKDCGKVVYEGQAGETSPTLICKVCVARRKREEQEHAAEMKRFAQKKENEYKEKVQKSRDIGLIWGLIIAVVALVIGVVVFWGGTFDEVLGGIAGSLVIALFTFTFVSQLFWNGAVVECIGLGNVIIGTPGIIFTFDLDGFLFLIGMQILFAVLRFLIWLIVFLFFLFAAIFISPFTFFFALNRVNRGDLVRKDF